MNRRIEKTIITLETFRRTTVHSRRAGTFWCGHCNAETTMISPDEAAAYLRCTTREVFRLAETGGIHFSETERGQLLVCRSSCQ